MNYYSEGTGLVSGYTPACLTWRSSPFFFAAGFLSSLRATAHPRTSRLWVRNLCDCWEWKRGAGGLRDTAALKMLLVYDSYYTPTVGYYSVNRFVCPGLLLLVLLLRQSIIMLCFSVAVSASAECQDFCTTFVIIRASEARTLCAFLCSDSHITASMCVTGCDKQESLHSRLLWKQVNYPRGSRRKKCVGTKAERAPTKWVWSWISFCELSWGAAGEWNPAGRC